MSQPEDRRAPNMHEDVPIWDDTPCCCEPEPRWRRVGEEMAERERNKDETGRGERRDEA